ncbi:MAG: ABC transporter permease [Thaumarchaeota archaeon]|nr:ABC transporter permease [Nitrososphaerota archaeon]
MESSNNPRRAVLSSKWGIRAISVAVVLAVWQLVAGEIVKNELIVPTPTGVAAGFVYLVSNNILQPPLADTLWTFAIGFTISVGVGIPVGALMARSRVIENILDPWVNALYTTPYVALVPLFIIWLHTDFNVRITVVVLAVIFVVIVNSFHGFKNADKSLVEAGRSFGVSGVSLYRKVVLPSSFPYIVTGLRLGIGRGLVGAIVAEEFFQLVGLGYLIPFYASFFQVGKVIAIVMTIGLIGLTLTETLKYGERRVSVWRTASTGG